ncbi:hypothetical protein HAALTHF_31090n [Vreelandella aquamarina]|nr:hypothetical protein HAALTHF_31090n [Halomonas axialensis]
MGCGERNRLEADPHLSVAIMATGFTWDTQNREADTAACQEVWQEAQKMLADPEMYLVVLDELTYMLKFGYLDIATVKQALLDRPQEQTVIITGRNAHRELVAMADTVTDMQEVRHALTTAFRPGEASISKHEKGGQAALLVSPEGVRPSLRTGCAARWFQYDRDR